MNYDRLLSALPTPSDETAWYDVIGQFKNKAAEFTQWYNTISGIKIDPVLYPELIAEKRELLTRGDSIKEKITYITGKVDEAWNWLTSNFGLSGYEMEEQLEDTGLGLLPIVPIAVVVGAVALIVKWCLDAKRFADKIKLMGNLRRQGYSPDKATEIIKDLENKTAIFNFGSALPVVLIGGFALLAWIKHRR